MIKKLINMLKETWIYLIGALAVTLILRYQFGPEFIDIFGIIIFGGIFVLGLWELYSKKQMPDWIAFALIVIGLGGIIVDGVSSLNLIKSYLHLG